MVENSVDFDHAHGDRTRIMNNERRNLVAGSWSRTEAQSSAGEFRVVPTVGCSAARMATTCSWSRDGVAKVQP